MFSRHYYCPRGVTPDTLRHHCCRTRATPFDVKHSASHLPPLVIYACLPRRCCRHAATSAVFSAPPLSRRRHATPSARLPTLMMPLRRDDAASRDAMSGASHERAMRVLYMPSYASAAAL